MIRTRADHGESFDDILRHRYPRSLSEAQLEDVYNELENKFLKPFVDSGIINPQIPNARSWDFILELMQNTNLSIGDAIHVDAAIGSNCNIFITNDSNLVKMIKELDLEPPLLASRPDPKELDHTLARKGIRPIVTV